MFLERRTSRTGVTLAAWLALGAGAAFAASAPPRPRTALRAELRGLLSELPFAMPPIQLPTIPERTCRVAEHGAVGDGVTLNTAAFARTIEACAGAGGGHVVVPRGLFLTGPIELKSRIDLHLERGAVLLFSPRFEDYPLRLSTWEGSGSVRCTSPIWAKGATDVAITGEGTIDGAGQAWRPVKRAKLTSGQWQTLVASGGVVDAAGSTWWPSASAMGGAELVRGLARRDPPAALEAYAAAREFLRPVLVSLVECRRVLLDGPTFQNSPAWNIHPLMCEDLVLRELTVLNPWYSQNGDGLDLDSCRRVIVYRCRFDVGDDAICLKSGRDAFGRRRGRPSEQIVVSDNVVQHGHGGFTIGSEMSGGVRDVLVQRCSFFGTDLGLRFKTTRGRGGIVERIWIRDVQMTEIATDAIGFNMYYGGESPVRDADEQVRAPTRVAAPVDEGTPRFQEIVLARILCRGAGRAVLIEGLPEMPIRSVVLDDVRISAETGLETVDAEAITLRRVAIVPRSGPLLRLRDSRNVTLENATVPEGTDVFLRLEGARSSGVRLLGTDTSRARRAVDRAPETPEGAVVSR